MHASQTLSSLTRLAQQSTAQHSTAQQIPYHPTDAARTKPQLFMSRCVAYARKRKNAAYVPTDVRAYIHTYVVWTGQVGLGQEGVVPSGK